MKYLRAILLSAAIALPIPSTATDPPPAWATSVGAEIIDGEVVTVVEIEGLNISSRRRSRRTATQRRSDRLVRNVKKVYPIAKRAEQTFREMETELAKIPREGARRKYIAKMERKLEREYTPILRKMTFSQGKILLKLIDRQTDKTSYVILREFQGKLRASLWQGIATLFDADLRQSYDPEIDDNDREIEQIVLMIEAGEI